jgi:hypothetical protein
LSKQHGSEFAKRRWENLPKEISDDFIGLTLLFKQTPVYWLFPTHYPLIIRSASCELVLQFKIQTPEQERLSELYAHWLWGVFSQFQTKIEMEKSIHTHFRVRYLRSSSFSQR